MTEHAGTSASTGGTVRVNRRALWRPIRRTLTYFPELKLVYMRNAKSATRTFLMTLSDAAERKTAPSSHEAGSGGMRPADPARRISEGILRHFEPREIMDATFFSVVRHPLTRLVSGYLDKIGPNSDARVWLRFCDRYGYDPNKDLAFPEFVAMIADDDPTKIDRHFRPQWINIGDGLLPLAHIGQLENLQPTMDFLKTYGIEEVVDYKPHSTGANNRYREFYQDSETLRKAIVLFQNDFDRFSYAPDVANIAPLAPVEPQPGKRKKMLKVLASLESRHRNDHAPQQEA